jgi:methionine synthase II (cobalamin-independent)
VFATIVGALPAPPDADEGAVLRAQLSAQLDAGIELLSFAEPAAPSRELVKRWREAAGIAKEIGASAVKAAILGPYSTATSHSTTARGDGTTIRGDADHRVEATRDVVAQLLDASCPLVEIHEPRAIAIGTSQARRALFADIQRRLTFELDGHLSLAITGGNADAAGPATIFAGGYRSYLFDLIEGPDNWRLITPAPPEAGIVVGALDHRPGRYEVPETVVWAAHYAASTAGRGVERIGVSTAGSLGSLGWDVAIARLGVLGRAAEIASLPPGEELARALDPRAVDIRSAAVGRYAPLDRRRRGGRPAARRAADPSADAD